MQWSDAIRPPSTKMLRQFAGLFLVVFLGYAAWRWANGRTDAWTQAIGAVALIVGVAGLLSPPLVRPIYTGWMIVAFPIGWTVSRVTLGLAFFGVLTPLAMVFRLMGRDLLRLRRGTRATYWRPKEQPQGSRGYFRQF